MGSIVRVVDVETSGLPEDEHHAICELGWVDLNLETLTITNPVTFLVNPGHPIPPHIRAIHHIGDADVAAAMLPDQAIKLVEKDLPADALLAAHNCKFEQAFIPVDRQWICTMKCAMRAWPDAVSHGNQALRYMLDIDAEPDFDPAAATPPHRALPDAYVTARILRQLVKLRPVERLLEITKEPPLTRLIRFGKHKGSPWASLPYDYLEWIINVSELDAETKAQATYWRDKRHVAVEA